MKVVPMTFADVDDVVHVHLRSFDGFMNTRLGSGYLRRFYAWFTNRADAIALKCVIDGQLAGFVVGAPFGYGATMNRELMGTVLWSVICRPWVLCRYRFLSTLGARARSLLTRSKPESGCALVGIAVSFEYRGAGVGSTLVEAFEREAAKRGHELLRLSVRATNSSALKLYERAGWSSLQTGGEVVIYEKRRQDALAVLPPWYEP